MTLALLQKGADPGAKNFMNNMPINLACSAKLYPIIKLLISFGSPLRNFTDELDREEEQEELIEDFILDVEQRLFDYFGMKVCTRTRSTHTPHRVAAHTPLTHASHHGLTHAA